MNQSEKKACEFLRSQGYTDIEYHPDSKNNPPDFLVNGCIAIEVRRLNQNVRTKDGIEGLEKVEISYFHGMQKLLDSLGPATAGKSWSVWYRLRRPLPPWKSLRGTVRSRLVAFRDKGPHKQTDFKAWRDFSITLKPRASPHERFFVLEVPSDQDAVGWVIPDLAKNLNICIAEKTKKIARVRERYPEWWLILVDHINFALLEMESETLRQMVVTENDWMRIILIDRRNARRLGEI